MQHAADLEDAALVARCRAGDQAAWGEFVERFSRYVYAVCVRGYGLAEHDAEDVFQEVFARAYERLDSLREDGAVRPWIAQMARRLCVDRHRAGQRFDQSEVEMDDRADAAAEERLAQIDEALTVHAALAELPESCQSVVERFFCADQSYAEIGEALQIPAGTIASRISRCLARMRSLLSGSDGRNLAAEPS